MAIRSGRVGVREDQVDVHGRIIATQHLIDQIKAALQEDEELVEDAPVDSSVIDVTPKKVTRKKKTDGD